MEVKDKITLKESLEQRAEGYAHKKIETLYFLVHPLYAFTHESYTPYHLFRGWKKKIDEINEKEILIFLSASSPADYKRGNAADKNLLKYAKKLGKRCFAFFRDCRIKKVISLLKVRGFIIDPETVESEAFGEYYSECVVGRAIDYNRKLKLCKPTYLNKELSHSIKEFCFFGGAKKSPYIAFSRQNGAR